MLVFCEKLDIKHVTLQNIVFLWPEIMNPTSIENNSGLSA